SRKPLRHVHSLPHHLFRPRQLLVRTCKGGRRTGNGERGLCVGRADSSSVGHLSALLAACGREIRRTRRGLGLRCQHDSVCLVAPRHLALRRTGHRTRAPTERTCRTLYPDCVGGPFHRSLFAPAYAMLSYLLNLASPLAALAVYGR